MIGLNALWLGNTSQGAPLALIQSHNDYAQVRPLFAALEARCEIIEVDLFLEQGELRVGHSRKELIPGRTLTSLYLRPLNRWIREGNTPPPFLMIDIKADGKRVFPALKREVRRFPEVEKKVRFLISGDRPVALVTQEKNDRFGLDGRTGDATPSVVTSGPWSSTFRWDGRGNMPTDQAAKLTTATQGAPSWIRFWGAPDRPATWDALVRLAPGKVVLNTDRPLACRRWLDHFSQ